MFLYELSKWSMCNLRRSTIYQQPLLEFLSSCDEVGEQCAPTLGVQKLRFWAIGIHGSTWIFLFDSCGNPIKNNPKIQQEWIV